MKYIFPFTAAAIAQGIWNLVLVANLGNFGNTFGDWVFSRRCNYGLCDGMWIEIAILIAPFLVVAGMLVSVRRSRS